MQRVGFDPGRDRLFSVGDLIDRGPESERALEWLEKPWFHAIRGNHEELAIRWAASDRSFAQHYVDWGGAWLVDLPKPRQQDFAEAFNGLPYAIEVETAQGLVGLVHAEVWGRSWQRMVDAFANVSHTSDLKRLAQQTLWERYRIDTNWQDPVEGVRAVVTGHATVEAVKVLGNVFYIDTGGWLANGSFTLIELATLNYINVGAAQLVGTSAFSGD